MAPAGIGDRVAGLHAVAAALAAGRVLSLVVEAHRIEADPYAELLRAAEAAAVPVQIVVDFRSLGAIDTPQGVIARCRPITPVTLEEAVAVTDPAALLVFDHVVDPRNLGAAVRSAVAAGFGAIVIPRRRSAPLRATAFKAAAGAMERVAIVEAGSIPDALLHLGRLGVWRVGLDAAGGQSLFDLELLTEPLALVVGAEGAGVSRLTLERCDTLVAIPHHEAVESLNASVAVALAVFEVARMRGWVS